MFEKKYCIVIKKELQYKQTHVRKKRGWSNMEEYYKREIIKMIKKIESERILKIIFQFVKGLLD